MSNEIVTAGHYSEKYFKRPNNKKNSPNDCHKTNEELKFMCDTAFDAHISAFFGIEGGLEALTDDSVELTQAAQQEVKSQVMQEKELKTTDDAFHQKKFERGKATITREYIEEKYAEEKEKIARGESISNSTDFVVEEPKSPYPDGSPWNRDKQSGPRTQSYFGGKEKGINGERVYYNDRERKDTTSRSTSSYQTGSTTKDRRKLDSVYDHMGRIADNTQNVAMKTKRWKDYEKEEARNNTSWSSGNGKQSLLGRIKRFVRKPKFRVTAKVGMLMTLQLGMAMVGKKYEFEGMGQAAAFLAMMMGVFYLTKELQNDDFDVKSFGIL